VLRKVEIQQNNTEFESGIFLNIILILKRIKLYLRCNRLIQKAHNFKYVLLQFSLIVMAQFKSVVGQDFAHPWSRTMDYTTVDFKQTEGF
jgi:hypothetical protein